MGMGSRPFAEVAGCEGLCGMMRGRDWPSVAQENDAVRAAIKEYHYALDCREHGGVAAHKALNSIQAALGMSWVQGASLALIPDDGNSDA